MPKPTLLCELDFASKAMNPSYDSFLLRTHPHVFYRMQETAGTVATDAAAGRNGTYAGVTLNQTAGKPVSAEAASRYVLFARTGVTGRLSVSLLPPTENAITIEALIYIDALGVAADKHRIYYLRQSGGMGDPPQLVFEVLGSGAMRFWNGSLEGDPSDHGISTTTAVGVIAAATWTHVALTFDVPARLVKFYKNGVLVPHVGITEIGVVGNSMYGWNGAGLGAFWGQTAAANVFGAEEDIGAPPVHRMAEPAIFYQVLSASTILSHSDARNLPTPPAPDWVDTSLRLRGTTKLSRGRDMELNRIEPSKLSNTLFNGDRALEPEFGSIPAVVTVSGNEITDTVRRAAVSGDGRAAPDSSYGIWEATTNLVTNGGFETNTTGWAGAGLTRVTTQAKFGTAAGQFVAPGAAPNEFFSFALAGLTVGASYVASAWLKGPVGARLYINLFDGTDHARADVVCSGDWQRVVTPEQVQAATTATLYVATDTVAPAQAITFWIDGVQVEQQPVATPYVHTDGATATRAAARVRAPASLLNVTQGWVTFRLRMGFNSTSAPDPNDAWVFSWKGAGSHLILCSWRQSSGAWDIRREDVGPAATQLLVADTFNRDDLVTLIFKWTSSRIDLSVDGGPFVGQANTKVPTLNANFDLGSNDGSLFHADVDILWFACGTGTLTDTNAAALHQKASVDRLLVSADPGTPTAYWNAESNNLRLGSPYFPNVRPRRRIRFSSIRGTVTDRIFMGYVDDFPQSSPSPMENIVNLSSVDSNSILNQITLDASFSLPQQLAGARISQILKLIGWPMTEVVLDAGKYQIEAAPGTLTGSVAEHLALTAASDGGVFFIRGDGYAVFHDGNHRGAATRSIVNQGTLSDWDEAGVIMYDEIVWEPGGKFIYNEMNLQRQAGINIMEADASSVAEYWPSSHSETVNLAQDSDVRIRVNEMLLKYKDPKSRFTGVRFNGILENASIGTAIWNHICAAEIGDRYTVVKHPMGGAAVTKVCFLESIDIEIDDTGQWEVTWGLSLV